MIENEKQNIEKQRMKWAAVIAKKYRKIEMLVDAQRNLKQKNSLRAKLKRREKLSVLKRELKRRNIDDI